MADYPFSPDVERTAIALAYRPEGLIADRVLPRTKVAKRNFTYTVFDRESLMKIPDTRIGRKSQANTVEFGSSEVECHVDPYGLKTVVPTDDDRNAPATCRPSDTAVLSLTGLIHLGREKRVADTVFDASTYGSNTSALSGTSRWSDYANSNPVTDLKAARDACVRKPNKLVLGQSVWSALSTHPKIVQAIYGITSQGIVSKEAVAQMLGVDEIIVGDSWHDDAPKGKGANRTYLWGKCAAFLHFAPVPTLKGGAPSFGLTAEYKGIRTQSRPVTLGNDGGTEYQVGEDLAEVIQSQDCGFLLTSVVA